MNEWGIPDWCDPAAYGDTEQWTFVRWRWEFNRRRQDYRQEAMQLLDLWGGGADRQSPKWHAYFRKWGYERVLDPRVSEYPDEELLTWGWGNVDTMASGPRQFMRVCEGEFAVKFKLDTPLAEQFKQAELAAKAAQKARHGKLVQHTYHPQKWFGYLRTLDARDAGAVWAEIAALHPNTAQTDQTGRDKWKSADGLRFSF